MSSRTAYAALIALSVAFAAVPVAGFAASPGDVVATVNGKEIKRSDVLALQQSMPQLRQVPIEMVYDQILEHLINSQLLVAEARKEKLQDDPKVKERLQAVEGQVLQQAFLQKKVEGQLTDEMLKKRYDELVKKAPSKEEVHARHILLTSEEEAKKAIAEIQGGKSFEDVAKGKSTGPSAENGGDLGYFGKDEMVPEFAEAAFAMKPGEISTTPVKTQFGWHVIKVEDKRTAKPPAFDEVKEELKEQVGDEMIMQVVQDLRGKADIKIIAPAPAAPAAPGATAPAPKGK
jgi:peptidyl-prolyl cis-trans isomerase C